MKWFWIGLAIYVILFAIAIIMDDSSTKFDRELGTKMWQEGCSGMSGEYREACRRRVIREMGDR